MRDSKNRPGIKILLQNTTLVLVSLLAVLLVCETGLRLTGYGPGNPFDRLINHYDEDLGYHMIPGMKETVNGPGGVYPVEITDVGFGDTAGFRDDGVDRPVNSVFVGDSFVWGYGVDIADSVSERFESLTGKDAVNMGMTSFTSPIQYARVFEKYAIRLKPRYLFVGFFIGNDFGDTLNFTEWEQARTGKSYPEWITDRIEGYNPQSMLYRIRRGLYGSFALYRFLSDRISLTVRDERDSDNIMHVKQGDLDLHLNEGQFPSRGPGVKERIMVREALHAIKNTGKEHSVIPVIFIIPTKEDVYQEYLEESAYAHYTDPRYAELVRTLEELRILYVDLLPVFREKAATGEQLYFDYDGHWNTKGHLLAARQIHEFLIKEGLEQTN
jgi:hypothetical protein